MEIDQLSPEIGSGDSYESVETVESGPESGPEAAVAVEEPPSSREQREQPRLFSATAHQDIARVRELQSQEAGASLSSRHIAVRAGARICTARRAASQVLRVTDAVVSEMRRHKKSIRSASR